MVSKASDDLPEPDRPVNTTSWSRGMVTSMFLRLCSRAPRMVMLRLSARAGRSERSGIWDLGNLAKIRAPPRLMRGSFGWLGVCRERSKNEAALPVRRLGIAVENRDRETAVRRRRANAKGRPAGRPRGLR